ncbi:hypothetical protein ACA910_022036 [Epithemia clementina (nom. ined.)]
MEFCHCVAAFLLLNNCMTLNMWDHIFVGWLGWPTSWFQTFMHHFDASVETSYTNLQALLDGGNLKSTVMPLKPWTTCATDPAMQLSQEESQSMVQAMLSASVNTTMGGNMR